MFEILDPLGLPTEQRVRDVQRYQGTHKTQSVRGWVVHSAYPPPHILGFGFLVAHRVRFLIRIRKEALQKNGCDRTFFALMNAKVDDASLRDAFLWPG